MKFSAGNRLAVAFVLGILILSSLAFLLLVSPVSQHPGMAGASSGGLRSAAVYGHGDLIVLSGQTVVLSPGTTGSTIYYEAGNISVHSGGTLIVQNLTIDWVQFIGVTGTVAQRLSNVFWFSDAGTVTLSHSIITTDPNVLNAFAKLNVTVTGKLVVTGSSFEFPGWVTVLTGGSLFLNNSASTSNPQVGPQSLSPTVLADEQFSPALQARGGGQIFIGNSVVQNYYADNYGSNGVPGPEAIGNTSGETTAPYGWAGFSFAPPVAQDIAQAYAWENTPIVNGILQVGFLENTPGGFSSGAGSTFTYHGTPYPLGSLNFGYAPGGALLNVPLGAAAVSAINATGVPAFLQSSGSFGTASSESLAFNFGISSVNVTSLTLILYPDFEYNITASGAGSRITAVDSALGVNFNPVPGTPVIIGTPPPPPWNSQKILLSGGANGFIGNVTVTAPPFISPFNDSSAVIPSGASQAYFYQWLEVPITGGRNAIPVANGTTSVVYAGSNVTLGATVAGLNNLGSADPILATYVSQALGSRGLLPTISGGAGVAWSMLLSTIVQSSLLPTGQFVGVYNVTVTVPPGAPGEITHVAASLTPYPQVVSPGVPFTSPPAGFPNYEANLALTGTPTFVATAHNSTVAIGQTLLVNVYVVNIGTAPTNNYSLTLTYPEVTGNVGVATSGLVTKPISAGQNVTVPLQWIVNETVTGHQGKAAFQVLLLVTAKWNGGQPDGGVNSTVVPVTITPAFISLNWTLPTGKLPTTTNTINSTGVATFAGKGTGTLTVLAVGQGQTYTLLTISITAGTTFETDLSAAQGMIMGDSYTIELQANYNGRTYTHTYGTLTVAGTTAPPFFLTQTFFGLPLWMWLAIAGGIVAAVLFVMFGLGRFARGRLVECGECGNLIPEDATVCPKCGAEFESDLVRCSRCGSTIPSTSAICPECAATLLARAGPENTDPERQSYADFVERFRTEAKKELGANYSEGAFWDWWKRQATYVSFSQWRLQQAQGTRTGMTAPIMTEEAAAAPPQATRPTRPPSGGAPPATGAAPPAARVAGPRPTPSTRVAPAVPAQPAPVSSVPAPQAAPAAAAGPAAVGAPGMKNCPNCGKQINADFLVCPFCGSVTG